MEINSDQKVAEILHQHPETYRVFRKHGCPDMRSGFFSLMARMMSIRSAARIHRIPVDVLTADLRETVNGDEASIE